MNTLMCTSNSLGDIDYGIPVVANKSTDYRTSTGTYHRLRTHVPQEFDCRVKLRVKPEILERNVCIKDNEQTMYTVDYVKKSAEKDMPNKIARAVSAQQVDYIRNVQEKIFQNPPLPMCHNLSEMKDGYPFKRAQSTNETVYPPEPFLNCEIKGLGRDEQPAVKLENKGFWKWNDCYLTTNRSAYIPFTKDQQNGLARKDIITFYDTSDIPKCKGFGPRNGLSLPMSSKGVGFIYDTLKFATPISDRVVRDPIKRVPHFGMQSEYQGNYKKQTFSDLHPYLHLDKVIFPSSLPDASKFQTLAAPHMYHTEYCFIGSECPTNAVHDPGQPQKFEH